MKTKRLRCINMPVGIVRLKFMFYVSFQKQSVSCSKLLLTSSIQGARSKHINVGMKCPLEISSGCCDAITVLIASGLKKIFEKITLHKQGYMNGRFRLPCLSTPPIFSLSAGQTERPCMKTSLSWFKHCVLKSWVYHMLSLR